MAKSTDNIGVLSQRADPNGWANIAASRAEDEDEQRKLGEFGRFLKNDFIQKRHLAVIAGLGCSLDATDKNGGQPAPTMQSLWDAVHRLSVGDGTTVFQEVCDSIDSELASDGGSVNIEHVLSVMESWVEINVKDDRFPIVQEALKAAKSEIVRRCDFVNSDTILSNHEKFLERLVWHHGNHRVHIFTTNYDRCFEEAGSRADMVVFDGFDFSTEPRFNPIIHGMDVVYMSDDGEMQGSPPLFKLYKLHGSIDWRRTRDGSRVERVRVPESSEPCIIYPQTKKYEMSYASPFAEMFAHLQYSLSRPDDPNLIVAGFGFQDSHITQAVMSMVATKTRMNLIIVDPAIHDNVERDPQSVIGRLYHLVKEERDERIHLINATFGNFWKILPSPETPADVDLMRKVRQSIHR